MNEKDWKKILFHVAMAEGGVIEQVFVNASQVSMEDDGHPTFRIRVA